MHDYQRTLRGNSSKAKRYHFSDLGLRPKLTLRPVMLSRHPAMGEDQRSGSEFPLPSTCFVPGPCFQPLHYPLHFGEFAIDGVVVQYFGRLAPS